MEIIINGKQAYMKENTSFDFIFENRLFTGSDSYTLTITFPLKGCARNIAIFGHINRADVVKAKVVFDCDIRDGAFFKSGSITITEISDVEVKTQFLEGRSEQNFDDTFDDIYLNEMDLGYPTKRRDLDSDEVLKGYPKNNFVPLPWVNNYSGIIHNACTLNSHFVTGFENEREEHTFQPYLLYILKRIFDELEYSYDFTTLQSSQYSSLLICNTLPAAWEAWNFAIAMPHWTLTEFFEQLENFLFGEFDINHKAKHVTFHFSNELAKEAGNVYIEKVIDTYTAEVSQEDDSKYLASCNMRYADNDALLWPYYSCDWYIRANKSKAMVFKTMRELVDKAETLKMSGIYPRTVNGKPGGGVWMYRGYKSDSDGNNLFYCIENDTYFVMYCYKSEFYKNIGSGMNFFRYYNRLQPVNQFGEYYVSDEADEIELKIVPAWIDGTDDHYGNVLFLNCGEMGNSDSWTLSEDGGTATPNSNGLKVNDTNAGGKDIDYNAGDLAQGKASRVIANGSETRSSEYFSCLYVGFWDGTKLVGGRQPHPVIDKIEVYDNFACATSYHTLRLKESLSNSMRSVMHKIDGKKKYSFSFLTNTIPNPRALFHIRGQKYICEKITATFHETGMSQLLKGVFYRVLDD